MAARTHELEAAGRRRVAAKSAAAAARAPQPFLVLRTKLLPPRPAAHLLSRRRLTDRLAASLSAPVTLVAANAGTGKTTLVSDFLRGRDHRFVWYQLDRTDADPSVFLSYLTHGIRGVVPGFGEVILPYVQENAGDLARQPETAADVVLNEALDKIEEQLILVLDDYHHLGADTPVHRVMDRLLTYMPDVLRVVIISREAPPLSLARLRSRSGLSIIDREELLFTDEETRELFREVFGLEPTPEQLGDYRALTQGWITGLQLIRRSAQRWPPRPGGAGQADVLRRSEEDIFDYFAEEVFEGEPADVRDLLLRLSLLDRIDAEDCEALYPDVNCRAFLPALVRRNVFVTVAADAGGEEYRLHPLFQGFLRRRLRGEAGASGVAAGHARCADFFLRQDRWEEALNHLVAAGESERAAAVVAERGDAWIARGALGRLASFIDALPRPAVEAHPRSLAHRAEVARLQGDYETADPLFRRAGVALRKQGDAEGEAEALHSLATISRRRGDYKTAFAYLDRAAALTDEQSVVWMKCGNTRGLCLVAMNRCLEAEREFRAALQAAEECGDHRYARLIAHNLGLPAMVRGDFNGALRWLTRMLRGGGGAPVPQEVWAHLNIARCLLYRGDLAATEQHLDRALEGCQLFNMTAQRGEAFEGYGNLHRERGDFSRAAMFYERAVSAYNDAGIEPWRFEVLEEKAQLKLQLGETAEARALLDRLIESRAESGDSMGVYSATLARSRVAIAEGDFEAAAAELGGVLRYFHENGLYFYEAQASLALAECDLAAGREVEMLARLRRALILAERYDYEHWLMREVGRNPRLFEGEAAALLPRDLRDKIPASRAEAAITRQAARVEPEAATPLPDLTINMLGPAEIVRDPARPLAADAWASKRARDILCFIASRRHRRASKDTIIDTFWGDSDTGAAEKKFHPAVSHIRKALNSNQPVKQNFLLYRDGDYLLSQDSSYLIDIEEFDRLVAEGKAAERAGRGQVGLALYEQAARLYRGEFMQGNYEDWVEEQRSHYREEYLRLLEALTAAAEKTRDWPQAMELAGRILREDPFREDTHCVVMHAHAALGNRAAVREQYESLRRLLRKELGVEPAAKVQSVYAELMG